MNSTPPDDIILGKQHDGYYSDAAGEPIAEGDLIAYFTSGSSTIYTNFAVVETIIDLDKPAYVGYKRGEWGYPARQILSWEKAYRLKVRKVEQDPLKPGLFRPKGRWNANAKEYEPIELQDAKLVGIGAVDRVLVIKNGILDD